MKSVVWCGVVNTNKMAFNNLSVLLLFLLCYQLNFNCYWCEETENANHSCSEATGEEENKQVKLLQEILSEFQLDGPEWPVAEQDGAPELWKKRFMKHRTDFEEEDIKGDADAEDKGFVVVNHFDLQQFPPRRILRPKSADEIVEEEMSASKKLPCPCDTVNVTENYGGTRFAYLITVHNYRTAQDATYLYRAIRDTGHPGAAPIILIHIDKKFAWQEFQQTSLYHQTAVINCTCSSITHVASIYDSEWAQWSMNYPTHWAMRLLITDARFAGKWDVFINISGDSMPTLTQRALSDLFHPVHGPLRNINFVTSSACETGLVPTSVYDFPGFWHKRKHYMSNRRQGPTISYVDYIIDDGRTLVEGEKVKNITIYFGSQWMSLQQDFVEYVVKSLDRKDSFPSQLKKWLQDTGKLMTDETFIPTIVMNVYPYNQTVPKVYGNGSLVNLPSIHAVRFERMDEQSPSAFGFYPIKQRYEVSSSSIADHPKAWGPYFLGVYDLSDIKHSGALFVRKVSVFVDPNIISMLPVESLNLLPDIKWSHNFNLSAVTDWESELEYMKQSLNSPKIEEEG